MRKLKLQTQMTLDGYMGGPDGEMDWMTVPWSDDLNDYAAELTRSMDTIVMGRKLAEGFIPYWADGPESEPQEAIDAMNETPKVVISRTLDSSPWENATVESDLAAAVERLKSEQGEDVIAYGGSTLVQSLLAEDLVDELHLFVNPAAIGAGLPLFPDSGTALRYRPATAQLFECGITVLRMEPGTR